MGKIARTFIAIILGAGLLLGSTWQAQAQSGIDVTNIQADYEFGEEIRFSAEVSAPSPIQEVLLLFRDLNEENTRVISLAEEAGRYYYAYDTSTNLLRPFATISYSFQVTLKNGESFTSESSSFIYEDNRFDWQMREEDNIRVHWSEGDDAFGQAALDTARNGLVKIQSFFPIDKSEAFDIYIYASPSELQDTLFMGGELWVAGHANPELGIVLVSIAPGSQQTILMQKHIPHELAHIVLYRHVGENYNRLPTWLLEGIASLAELYPNPDYQLALERAVDANMLIPISELCQPFSRDASQAFLSYAEAASFTRYLHSSFGSSGLDELIRTYADGISCETGVMRVFSKPITYLDASWQESVLGANLLGVAFRETLPYLLLFAIILISPLGQAISSLRRQKNNDR
ncbi:MAG: hypothetical protein HN855_02020 [Anaerolineae bacterium]|nr:hypothetical protein [Anaerolineae bacterium]MBT7073104.1 hypothetical protein [Anaerolineae bacterium]MBT7323915.1 hypothetical protein [Anaerolineae bacterium]